jgi:hypothetical protein
VRERLKSLCHGISILILDAAFFGRGALFDVQSIFGADELPELGGFAIWDGQTGFSIALAAVLGEIGQQPVHRLILCLIDHRPAVAVYFDQPSAAQSVEMKGQGIWGEAELLRDRSRSDATRSCHDQKPENIEAAILRERP